MTWESHLHEDIRTSFTSLVVEEPVTVRELLSLTTLSYTGSITRASWFLHKCICGGGGQSSQSLSELKYVKGR